MKGKQACGRLLFYDYSNRPFNLHGGLNVINVL